ncbi:D-arabinono-1,4-lactone oxidase [Microlunatus antarcticus]|uniref:FAD/FMN-containing dehydrogenase n=1 Tax=Microlunatus antarcticus TaxID=53388 RepID=A0A7W5JUK9_9ACTN|nr:D-arabinono-1,4-lactone oxidase [Microlunatus antarcticus]MBB3326622.1 FAD/FMN-containing dehydrogenase [Microlunatus antarcticus]
MARDDLAYPRRQPDQAGEDVRTRNWARNATLGSAGSVRAPRTEDELRELLATTQGGVRVIGSRMSPGRMLSLAAQGDTLLDLSHLRGLVHLGEDRATFAAATTLGEIYTCLSSRGRMLPSSPGVIAHQTLAGALATGTHGQGLGQSCIADSALSVRMVLADGSVAEYEADHPWFGAVKLGLGLLGVVTQVTLRTVPSPVYSCQKAVTSAATLETDLLTWNRDNALSKAWWFPDQDQVHVWTAQEASETEVERYRAGGSVLIEEQVTSAVLNSTVDRTLEHMRGDTKILDEQGKPFQTVNRFKDFSDVTGDVYQVFCRGIATPQINVEIGIPLASAGRVVAAIKRWHAETRPHMHYPVILRATGASDSWLSPSYGQETCFFGFVVYYAEDGSLAPEGVDFLRAVERVLAEEGGRPHWGKYFDEALYDWSALYPRWAAFRGVRAALDPHHRFDNAFTSELFAPTVHPSRDLAGARA